MTEAKKEEVKYRNKSNEYKRFMQIYMTHNEYINFRRKANSKCAYSYEKKNIKKKVNKKFVSSKVSVFFVNLLPEK
jgi:hypothetical protein